MNIIMERDLNLRQQINPDKECLKYPYIYEYDLTPSLMFNEPVEEPIDFPKCVIHYYWIHEGISDEVPWRALFQYRDNTGQVRYGFYLGECDYTGFDCDGTMRLFISDKIDTLIEKAFTNQDYFLYVNETHVNL